MRKPKFIRKPLAAFFVVVIVALAILYIQSQKASVNPQSQNAQSSNKSSNIQAPAKTGLAKQNVQDVISEKESKYPKAPDFKGIERWINSEPLSIEQLRGKVVLVDFWTYSCINCIRTLPYLKEWDKKYRDKGLVIIGVHSPEFEFEKKYENVLKAVTDYQLKYPVAQDNLFVTWQLYKNRFWPHKYLIDIDGFIRYDHIGEGGYGETEKIIQELINKRMGRLNQKNGIETGMAKPEEAVDVSFQNVKTPEIYFGYQFDRGNLGYQGLKPDSITDFRIAPNPYKNYVYLSGKWKYNADNMELLSDEGEILLIFEAKNANIVAGSESSSEAFVFLDNEFENGKNRGSDVVLEENKSISRINEFKLYNIASAEDYGTHVININVAGKGFKIYTFTFG